MKFKLTAKVKFDLFQIEALVDIPSLGIKAGDKGGYIANKGAK